MRHSVLLFSLISYSSSSCHATLSQTQFYVKELAIAKTAKYEISLTIVNADYS